MTADEKIAFWDGVDRLQKAMASHDGEGAVAAGRSLYGVDPEGARRVLDLVIRQGLQHLTGIEGREQ